MLKIQDLFKIFFKKHPVTATLILINTVMFFVTIFTGGFSVENLVSLGGLVPAYVSERQEYHRLLLAMFLHGSFLHFFMNTYFLYYIGVFVEKIFGSVKFSIIYLISGLGSSLLIWLLGDPLVVTIGASGSLFGIMGVLLLLTFTRPNWFPKPTVKSIRTLTIINLVFTILMPNISVLGHLGGFITGILLALILTPKKPHQTTEQTYYQTTYQSQYQHQDNVFDYEDVKDKDDDDDLFS